MHPVSQIICIVAAVMILVLFLRQRRSSGPNLLFFILSCLPGIMRRGRHEKNRARFLAQNNSGECDMDGFFEVPGKPGWKKGRYAKPEEIYSAPQGEVPDGFFDLWGLIEEADPSGHRLYRLPVNSSVREIVETFDVGCHGCNSYGLSHSQVHETVISRAESLLAMLPGRVTFVDSAGLKIQFSEPVTDAHLKQIHSIFGEYGFESGEYYFSQWDGESEMYQEIKETGVFHFWWD
jgi:hypothetical protein